MNYKFPLHAHPAYREEVKGSWLMLLEIMNGSAVRAIVDYARNHEMKVAGIFHDAIPWLHPEYVRHRSRQEHADYMAAFAGLDVVIPVSRQAEKDYLDFLNNQHLSPPPLHTCTLPAEILGHARETGRKETASDVVRILYVSTLEPRKNHLLLLAAFDKVCVASEGQRLELHLVGNRYPGAPEIAEAVGVAIKKNPRIFWHEDTSHAELLSFYEACDFTVFVSSVEGFGLPVMESLWLARPCLCTDTGVVAENARDGGCFVVNVQDPQALTNGLWRLANQPDLRRDLTEEALMRKLKTWEGYADEILQILQEVERNPTRSALRTALPGL